MAETHEQDDKVRELERQGYKRLPLSEPHPPTGGPIALRDPAGKVWLVMPDGTVVPSPKGDS